ncbi:MAG: TVP38/TMEM64 family protein [Clostridia bacterium]|nr:TVP38/TMEM64 family protein [Clostridia bacterium]
MKKFNLKTNTIKKIIFPFIILLVISAILLLRKDSSFFSLFKDAERLKEYILSYGSLAPVIFGVIQFLQVIISPIPGNITTLAGGALFGFWNAFLISSVAIILGSAAAFAIARIFGRPFVEWILGKETVSEHLDTINTNKKIIFVLIILLPFFPDDIICFIAGISGMSWGFFMLTMVAARPPGLIVSALIGANGLNMPTWAWILIFASAASVIFAYIKVKNHIDKRKAPK